MHGPPWRLTQRLPPSLTPLDAALAALLKGLDPLAPVELQLTEAAGCIAAGNPLLAARPSRDVAAADGWALRANDLVGASSYSPLPLATAPRLGRSRRRDAGGMRLCARCRRSRGVWSALPGVGGGRAGAGRQACGK